MNMASARAALGLPPVRWLLSCWWIGFAACRATPNPATATDKPLFGTDIEVPGQLADAALPADDAATPALDATDPSASDAAVDSGADLLMLDNELSATDADSPTTDVDSPTTDADSPTTDADSPTTDVDSPTTDADSSASDADSPGTDADVAEVDATADTGICDPCTSGAACATPCVAVTMDAAGNVVSQCKGTWICGTGGKPECDAPEPAAETCNGQDDDCDGQTDEGALCDDGNPCTQGDACKLGTCTPGANTCECQTEADCKPAADLCTGDLICEQGKCGIKAGTAVKCAASLDTPCSQGVCQAQTGLCAAVALNEGGPCDADGNVCTVSDKCSAGTCLPGPTDGCDDANPCTTDACDKTKGCSHVPNSNACDDGNPCTNGALCSNGACTGGAVKPCDDGKPCTTDACDPKTGVCASGAVAMSGKACDDGDACTVDDLCDAGLCKSGKGKSCDDGNPCTVDACQNGACGSNPGDGPCDDGNACTAGDACKAGKCAGGGNICECLNDLDCAAKSNGNQCAGKYLCQANKCAIALATAVVCDASQNNACATNTCNGQSGLCAMVASVDGKACDDGSACTSGDTCKAGACAAGAAIKCDDGNPCTSDGCTAGKGCVYAANTDACDDTNACTTADTCKAGACVGVLKSCSDGSDCTADSCDVKSGTCSYVLQAACIGKKWQRAIGSAEEDNFYGVVHTKDGGFVAAGHTKGWSAGGIDALLVKVDACGNLLWAKNYGGSKDDLFWGVATTADGGFIGVGSSKSWPGTYVVKTDALGNAQWQNVYGGGGWDFGRKIIQLKDGGYAFITEQYSYSSQVGKTHKATITKIDSAGAMVWVHTYGGGDTVDSEGDAPFQIVEMDDGTLMVAGGEESDSFGSDDIWLFRLDKDGKHLASYLYGSGSDDEAADMIRTSDGGFLMTGHTTGWDAIYHSKDIMLIKISADMKVAWMKRWGGFDDDRGAACFETADGYVVTGRTGSFGFSKDTGTKWEASASEKFNPNLQFDMFYAKVDKKGTLQSMKIYGNAHTQYGFAGDYDTSGGFILAGQTFGFGSGKSDGFLVKIDGDGDSGGSCDTKSLALSSIDKASCSAKVKTFKPQDFGGGYKLPSAFSPGTAKTPISTPVCVCQ